MDDADDGLGAPEERLGQGKGHEHHHQGGEVVGVHERGPRAPGIRGGPRRPQHGVAFAEKLAHGVGGEDGPGDGGGPRGSEQHVLPVKVLQRHHQAQRVHAEQPHLLPCPVGHVRRPRPPCGVRHEPQHRHQHGVQQEPVGPIQPDPRDPQQRRKAEQRGDAREFRGSNPSKKNGGQQDGRRDGCLDAPLQQGVPPPVSASHVSR